MKGPGDIEMRPGCALGNKLLQEQAGSQGPGHRSADIVEVGAGRFQQFLVFFGQRQFPESFAVILSGLDHGLDQLRIVAHDPGDARSQSADARRP